MKSLEVECKVCEEKECMCIGEYIKGLGYDKQHLNNGGEIILNLYKKNKKWYLNGFYHRVGGPACKKEGGVEIWYLHGKRHREDGPAFINSKGEEKWYLHGELHREEGPAITRVSDRGYSKFWYKEGKEHRDDGPAYIHTDLEGNMVNYGWYKNDICHRDNGPARRITHYGYGTRLTWYNEDKEIIPDFEKGYFIEYDGSKVWYAKTNSCWWDNSLNRFSYEYYIHRDKYPAIEYPDGRKEWYIKGERVEDGELEPSKKTKSARN